MVLKFKRYVYYTFFIEEERLGSLRKKRNRPRVLLVTKSNNIPNCCLLYLEYNQTRVRGSYIIALIFLVDW